MFVFKPPSLWYFWHSSPSRLRRYASRKGCLFRESLLPWFPTEGPFEDAKIDGWLAGCYLLKSERRLRPNQKTAVWRKPSDTIYCPRNRHLLCNSLPVGNSWGEFLCWWTVVFLTRLIWRAGHQPQHSLGVKIRFHFSVGQARRTMSSFTLICTSVFSSSSPPAIHNILPPCLCKCIPQRCFKTSRKTCQTHADCRIRSIVGKKFLAHPHDLIYHHSSFCNFASAILVFLLFLECAHHIRALHWLFHRPELLFSKVSTLLTFLSPPGLWPNITNLVKCSFDSPTKRVNLWQTAMETTLNDPCLLVFMLLWHPLLLSVGWNEWLISNH